MNATTHPVAPEEVMAFLDGELFADRAQTVSTHLEQCARCRVLEASLGSTSQSIGGWTVKKVPSALEDHVATDLVKTSSESGSIPSGQLPWLPRWTKKRWVLTVASAGFVFLLLLAISIPNLLRSKMAANEASEIGRQRAAEAERIFQEVQNHAIVADSNGMASSGARGSLGKLEPGSPSASPVARSRFPITDQQSKTVRGVATLASPGVAADSNGLFHGLGDHAQNSFSVNGQPMSDQQSRIFSGPMIARSASLSLVTKSFDTARTSIDAILERHNGYSANLTINTPQGGARSLQASLRVPVSQLAAALEEIKTLGYVENQTQSGEEVTQQHADLAERLKISRETERRFLGILRERNGDIYQVLSTEQAIARVRGEIEQMEAEQKALEHRVDFATIDLNLAEEYKAQLTTPSPSLAVKVRNSTIKGFRNALGSLLSIVLFIAESGPTLLLWLAILGLPAWLLWRRYRRAHALGSLAGA